MMNFQRFWNEIRDTLLNFRVNNVIDILIIAAVIYQLYKLVKETRAEQLAKGLVVLIVVTKLSEWLKLYTLRWVLERLLGAGLIAIVVIFQPEIRRAFEYIGRSRLMSTVKDWRGGLDPAVDEIVQACASLSRQKIGALIVLERKTGLNEIVETGTEINGKISMGLLINIFIPKTPLHDGAVIIKRDVLRAAACFLPITDNNRLSKELGTRHRAALGISERSDCLVIVVSEETGAISTCEAGEISRYLDEETLRRKLADIYNPAPQDMGFFAKLKGDFYAKQDEQSDR